MIVYISKLISLRSYLSSAQRYRKNIFHFLPIEDEWNLIDKSSHDLRYDPLITGGNGRKKVYRHTRKVVMFRIQTSEIYGLLEGGRKPRVNRSQAYTWVNFVTVTLTNRQFRDFRIIPSSSSKIKIHNFTYLRYLILASDTWSSEIKIHEILRSDFLQCEKKPSIVFGRSLFTNFVIEAPAIIGGGISDHIFLHAEAASELFKIASLC